ncbi:MAG: hypothetical protein FWD85_03390 [Microbacteriaceae bacterium]|nr:hypothetical protein [Microbacteriaceae bacterium]MCL2794334.1 hypothetical protein [Microbacteriaceae bacterium]
MSVKLPTLSQPGFDLVFGYVYTGLAVNLSMALANLPLAVSLALVRQPGAAWPFFVVLSLTLAPSLVGAFTAFDAMNAGDTRPFRAFWLGWRRGMKRAGLLGLALDGLVLVVGLDLASTAGAPVGAALVPVLVAVVAVAVAVVVLALAGFAAGGVGADAPTAALLKASVYLAIRRWPLTLLSLAALTAAVAFVLAQPVLGTLLGVAPLLFVVFSNARATLAPLAHAAG